MTKIWHIIGNGPGTVICVEGERRVRFNQPTAVNDSDCLIICNGKVAEQKRPFVVQGGLPDEQFVVPQLVEHAAQLQNQLGCWPSCGLVALSCLRETNGIIKISAMNLLPSLERPTAMGPRQPLPCAFHNWLGERRLAQAWLERLQWPAYELPFSIKRGFRDEQCFERLMALPSLSRRQASIEWQSLAAIDELSWCESASVERLRACEPLFFLSRGRTNTNLWWMYDNAVSVYVSRVYTALAVAQQTLHHCCPLETA